MKNAYIYKGNQPDWSCTKEAPKKTKTNDVLALTQPTAIGQTNPPSRSSIAKLTIRDASRIRIKSHHTKEAPTVSVSPHET